MVNQIIAILVSFSFIPILTRKKIKFSYTLLIVAIVLGITSKIGFRAFGQAIINVFINSSSKTTILTVFMVSILGDLMKHYNILDEIVNTLLELIGDKKKILMIIPAMMGLLIIPGGALLSAPFINNLGEDMKLPPPRRAAINLVFRHIAMFVVPYSTSLLIVAAELPEINIFKLISMNLVFVASSVVLGYFLFLKNLKSEVNPKKGSVSSNLLRILIYTSPIYLAIVINAIAGLPFYITLIGSVFIVYLLGDKKNFVKVTFKSISWSTVLTVTIILFIKEIILNMEGLLGIFNIMFNTSNSILSMIIVFLISSFFFGYITGNITASLAIILPMISQANISGMLLYLYTYFAYGASFLGYFFSPLHLCQAFTLEHMGVTTGELYKEYRLYAPVLLVVLIFSTFVFNIVLL